jgi:hypothetical protein
MYFKYIKREIISPKIKYKSYDTRKKRFFSPFFYFNGNCNSGRSRLSCWIFKTPGKFYFQFDLIIIFIRLVECTPLQKTFLNLKSYLEKSFINEFVGLEKGCLEQ